MLCKILADSKHIFNSLYMKCPEKTIHGNRKQITGGLGLGPWLGWWCSVSKSSLTLCNPLHCSISGFPVLHYLLDSQWCYLTISSSAALFNFCPQSFPGSGSFPVSQLFSLHQVAKVLELQHQSFRIDLFDFLAVRGTLKSLLRHHSSKASIHQRSAFFIVQHSHPYMTTGKTIALTRQNFVSKVTSLLLNVLSRFVIALFPRSEHLLTSWLQSPSAVILESKERKVCHCFYFFLFYLPWSYGTSCHDISFLGLFFFFFLSFKQAFSLSSFTLIKRLLGSSLLSAIRVVSPAYMKLLIFFLTIFIPACDSSNLAFCTK